MSRLRCGQGSDSDGRDLLYAGPSQHAGPHHSTALMEHVLAGARLDRVDGEGSRCNGPTRSRSQDVTVGGWVTIRGRQTTLTDLLGGRFCTLPL